MYISAMNAVDKTLYTKSEYSRKYGVSRPTIDKMITDKRLSTLTVNGTILIRAK